MSWRQGQTAILTQVLLLTIAALLSHLGWGCSTVSHRGPQSTQSTSWFSLWHPVCRPGTCLYYFLTSTCFHLFTQVDLLIDDSVEGLYITIIPALFFKIPLVDIFLTSLFIPPHILQIMLKDNNSKNIKRKLLDQQQNTKILIRR